MKHSFVRVMLSSPHIKIGNVDFNTQQVVSQIKIAKDTDTEILILGQNILTGNAMGNMLYSFDIKNSIQKAIDYLDTVNRPSGTTTILGVPLIHNNSIIDAIVILNNNKPIYLLEHSLALLDNTGQSVSVSLHTSSMLQENNFVNADLTIELCADKHFVANNMRKNNELCYQTHKNNNVAITISTGQGDSIDNINTSRYKAIAERGRIVACSDISDNKAYLVFDVDLHRHKVLQNRCTQPLTTQYHTISISKDITTARVVDNCPTVPKDVQHMDSILNILKQAILQRIDKVCAKGVVFGLSGGIDSAMVLMLSVWASKEQHFDIHAVTMNSTVTSNKSKQNALALIKACKVKHIDIDISNAIVQHMREISHTSTDDTVYENLQARRRASILLDIANKHNALLLGTADMSEIALGWSTYGGDQLAHFNPNSGMTKSGLQRLIVHLAQKTNIALDTIKDIVAAPISPELKPNQRTEELLGNYQLFDFILYHLILVGCSIDRLIHLCIIAYPQYNIDDIKQHIRTFIKRFFNNQFKQKFGCDGIILSEYDIKNVDTSLFFDPNQLLKLL